MSRSPLPRRAARAGGLIALFALLALLPALLARPVQAQAAQVQHWGTFAVIAQINPNSTFNVTEQQELVFDSGTFRGSFRYIPTNRLTGITDVGVAEQDVGRYQADNTPIDLANGRLGPAHTFQVLHESGRDRIIWFYGTVQSPARKVMIITYKISGGLRFYTGGDQFWWNPFPTDRTGRIEQGRFNVQFPGTVNLSDPAARSAVYPDGSGTIQISPQQAVFTAKSPLGRRRTWKRGCSGRTG